MTALLIVNTIAFIAMFIIGWLGSKLTAGPDYGANLVFIVLGVLGIVNFVALFV